MDSKMDGSVRLALCDRLLRGFHVSVLLLGKALMASVPLNALLMTCHNLDVRTPAILQDEALYKILPDS